MELSSQDGVDQADGQAAFIADRMSAAPDAAEHPMPTVAEMELQAV